MTTRAPILSVRDLVKTFHLHIQGGLDLTVLDGLSFDALGGECLALRGPSGAGKSTALRMIYGNYTTPEGEIIAARRGDPEDPVNIARADPRTILDLRTHTIGYVSQFLRAVPRVPAVDIVAEPLLSAGEAPEAARDQAGRLLAKLRIPERLWSLPPATFSGGEQQRINIARGLIRRSPILLLDEPTAALDRQNRNTVIDLIEEAKSGGSAVVGIFHDDEVRDAVADRVIEFDIPEAVS